MATVFHFEVTNQATIVWMKRDCPTIQELLAFDAVARLESVTLAASMLCITISAVSKQLSGLERFVGCPLLQKHGRGVQLTPRGLAYWQKVAGALRVIETATFEARAGDARSGMLTLACVPTFLTKWLIPRLPDFNQSHRHVTLNFSRHLEPSDGMPAAVDAAIRFGSDTWPGMVSDYIAGREFVLIGSGSPKLALRGGNPSRVAEHTLLHHESAPTAWRQWAAEHSVPTTQVMAGPRFAQYSALIQAAHSGLGLGLVPRILVLQELAEGSLTIPFGRSVSVDQGHYLCYPPDRLGTPAFVAFRDWILNEGRASANGF